MTRLLYPRLSNLAAKQHPPLSGPVDLAKFRFSIENDVGPISWAASGGSRISIEGLQNIRQQIITVAKSCGFPESSTQSMRADFDLKCTKYLSEDLNMPTGEALRDDVWTYFAAALLPDVCIWRFNNPPDERILGGVRNTFQRLWLRGRAFDRGKASEARWELLAPLSEDAMVQIIERPSVSADPRLAGAIAECWAMVARKVPRNKIEDITRAAVRNIRIANEVVYFSALSQDELLSQVTGYFSAAAGKELR